MHGSGHEGLVFSIALSLVLRAFMRVKLRVVGWVNNVIARNMYCFDVLLLFKVFYLWSSRLGGDMCHFVGMCKDCRNKNMFSLVLAKCWFVG
jgi:hypothetical protein